MSLERRISPRLMICVPCRISAGENQISCRSYDLSEGGAALMSDIELAQDGIYSLEIRWLQGEPSHFRGRVRYCRQLKDGHYMSGLCFIEPVPEQGREILRSLRPTIDEPS